MITKHIFLLYLSIVCTQETLTMYQPFTTNSKHSDFQKRKHHALKTIYKEQKQIQTQLTDYGTQSLNIEKQDHLIHNHLLTIQQNIVMLNLIDFLHEINPKEDAIIVKIFECMEKNIQLCKAYEDRAMQQTIQLNHLADPVDKASHTTNIFSDNTSSINQSLCEFENNSSWDYMPKQTNGKTSSKCIII